LCDPKRRILAQFQPRGAGSAFAFIHVVTKRLVIDHYKSIYSVRHGEGITRALLERDEVAAPDGGSGTASSLENAVLFSEIDTYLQDEVGGPTCERDRRIFWYHIRAGMSAREIAALPVGGLTAKGVESVILRLKRLVREFIVRNRETAAKSEGS
jgi:hypothetical protein